MRYVVAIPVYNEEKILDSNVRQVHDFLIKNYPARDWRIVIADNHSTDKTAELGKALAAKYPEIQYLYVAEQGKGVAIRRAWESCQAEVYAFMDSDLATDLAALPSLFQAITKEGFDGAYGSRFHPKSQVERSLKRRIFSWGYRMALRKLLNVSIADAPCGFKAISQKLQQAIVPRVQNNAWFFDSELMIMAEGAGYKLKEIPVQWAEHYQNNRRSKVRVVSLAREYLSQLILLRRRLGR